MTESVPPTSGNAVASATPSRLQPHLKYTLDHGEEERDRQIELHVEFVVLASEFCHLLPLVVREGRQIGVLLDFSLGNLVD